MLVNANQDDSQRLVPAADSRPVDGQRNENAPVVTSPWSPPGTELASSDLGPATMVFGGPVVAALTRQVGIEGHPPIQVISTSMAYVGHATAFEQVCMSENAGSTCRPEWVTPSWSIGMTSSVDNGDATGMGRYLQVNLYAGGSDGFLVRTEGEYPPLPPEDILMLDEFEQVASYPSGDRFRYNRLLDDATVLEIAGTGFEDVESLLEIATLVVTSMNQ